MERSRHDERLTESGTSLAEDLSLFAQEVAAAAAAMIMTWFGKDLRIEHKSATDLVTEADTSSERFIINRIRDRFPDHQILSEESEPLPGSSPVRWLIDPLDGTTNFAHRMPIFCVSIAAEVSGTIIAGAVVAPALGESFSAFLGGGAKLNGHFIHVSNTDSMLQSLIATGFPYDLATDPDNNLDHFVNIRPLCQGIRRCGAASWDLCSVACGRLDGYWEAKLKPWDVAAGMIIVKEAGGAISGFRGQPTTPYQRQIVATNGKIQQQLLRGLALGHTLMSVDCSAALRTNDPPTATQ